VIEHFKAEQQKSILNETLRILRRPRFLLLSTPNKGFVFHAFWRCYYKFRGTWSYGYERSYSLKELARLVEREGFIVIATKSFGQYMCVKDILDPVRRIIPKRLQNLLFHILLKFFTLTNIGFYASVVAKT